MTLSKVAIANLALSHLGSHSIASFTEGSSEADQVNTWYDYCRQEVLEAYNWSFARKRIDLALSSSAAPTQEWSYRYQYPADCVAMRYLVNAQNPEGDAIPFSIEMEDDGISKSIVTNLNDAEAVYTFDQTNTAVFTPLFALALSYLLAAHTAYALTGKEKLGPEMLQIYQGTVMMAAARNSNENRDAPPREAEWIRNR